MKNPQTIEEIKIVLESLNDVVKLATKQQKTIISKDNTLDTRKLNWNLRVIIQCANELLELNNQK